MNNLRKLSTSMFVFMAALTGCAQSPSVKEISQVSQEEMLVKTDNGEALVALYKNKLREEENSEDRIKLASAYLELGDYDSALFVIERLDVLEAHAPALLIKAKALLNTGKTDECLSITLKAIQLEPNKGEAQNLYGMILAFNGKHDAAKQHLIRARELFYDDIVVQNNLAMIDILKGDYQSAADILMPLYERHPTHQQVEANLVFALLKLGEKDTARQILIKTKNEKYVDTLLQDVNHLNHRLEQADL